MSNSNSESRADSLVPRERLAQWLNSIQWRSRNAITATASERIQRYATNIEPIIQALRNEENLSIANAHGFIITAGHESSCGTELLDELFDYKNVRFTGAIVREPIIMTIVAAYCWGSDPSLNRFQNPLLPLISLIGLGYPISFDDDEDEQGTSLCVGTRSGIETFRIA